MPDFSGTWRYCLWCHLNQRYLKKKDPTKVRRRIEMTKLIENQMTIENKSDL